MNRRELLRLQIIELKAKIKEKVENRNLKALKQTNKSDETIYDITDNEQTIFKKIRKLSGHSGKIYALDWSSDSTEIVSASQDSKIIVWDAKTSKKRLLMSNSTSWIMACAFSPSGRLVATGGLNSRCMLQQYLIYFININ